MKKILLLILFLFIVGQVVAENLNSERYRIQFGDVNIGGDNLNSSSYDLSISLGQLAAQEFQSSGYIVKAGFQYLHSIIPFRFSISDTNIDFGTLTSNTPTTATTSLTVYFGGAGQYQVTAQEENPLKKSAGASIVDTSCNGQAETCTETAAKQWTSSNAYGFGYNMSGNDIPADFKNINYYRPFPDKTAAEAPVVVMSSSNVGKNRQATVIFKVNVSAIQEIGSYSTVVQFTATPTY